jgi:hypothetical protein
MRGQRAGRIAALLGLGLAVAVAPAQSPTYRPVPAMQGSLWDDLWGTSKPKPIVTPDGKPEVKPDTTALQPAPDKAARDNAARTREHERLINALDRRLDVCLRLKEIAIETNNAALEAEAQRLEDLAFKLYINQGSRVMGMPAASMSAEDLDTGKASPNSAAALGKGSPGGNLPGRGRSNGRTAPESADQSAAMREVER